MPRSALTQPHRSGPVAANLAHSAGACSVLLRGRAERISATRLPSKRVIDCQIDDFVSDSNDLWLIGAFMRIDNADLRRKIVMLVQEIAGDDGN
jgi:hypothetical protein